MAESHAALRQGRVRCTTCGREQQVDAAACLRDGWPTCHGETMRLQPVTQTEGGDVLMAKKGKPKPRKPKPQWP